MGKMQNIVIRNSAREIELEEQFILRLPQKYAEIVRNGINHLKHKKFKKLLKISLNRDKKDMRIGTVEIKKHVLHAKLVNLPCIVESQKTIDKIHLFKTADISQMLVCQENEYDSEDIEAPPEKYGEVKKVNKKYLHPHGIAPSLKNLRKQRFRKHLRCKEDMEEVAEIEKEVLCLLREDNEAVSTRFEFYYEDNHNNNKERATELTLFGEELSDSDDEQVSSASSKGSINEAGENV